jgi:DNA-binding MarR family transcriptional regulator
MQPKKQLSQNFFNVMLKVARASNSILGMSLPEKATTALQIQALDYIKDYPRATVNELAEVLHMSSPAITQFTNRLVRNGLVLKDADKNDKRKMTLFLTELGKKEEKRLSTLIGNKAEKMFQYISEQDVQTLVEIMQKMSSAIDQKKK